MSILKATRRHYAALQHRPGEGRVGLRYHVYGATGLHQQILNYGTVWVKAANLARQKAEITKLMNRLRAMYPWEAKAIDIEVWSRN